MRETEKDGMEATSERCALTAGQPGPDGLPHWHTSRCFPDSNYHPGPYVGSYAGSDPWSDARDNRRDD